jgi:hypothetical protein
MRHVGFLVVTSSLLALWGAACDSSPAGGGADTQGAGNATGSTAM